MGDLGATNLQKRARLLVDKMATAMQAIHPGYPRDTPAGSVEIRPGASSWDLGGRSARARDAAQASTLLQYGNAAAAEAYCASRLPGRSAGEHSLHFPAHLSAHISAVLLVRPGGWNYGGTRTDFGEPSAELELLARLLPTAS